MSGNIQTLFTTLTGVKQDFKIDWKEDAKADWKVDWAVTAPPVPGVAPANTALPTITGTAQNGQMLTAVPGTWTGTPAPTLSYQWYNSYSGSPVGTGLTYTVGAGDVGYTIYVKETATNASGTVSANSASTATVV